MLFSWENRKEELVYLVSDDFIKAVNSNSRRCFWSGTITTIDGHVYEFANKDRRKAIRKFINTIN